jgi:hypothetical protein
LRHFASPAFWALYRALPEEVRDHADKAYALLKENPRHPSLHFKKIGRFRSARVGLHYRALAVDVEEDLVWFWIGKHDEYDRLVK